VKQKYCWFDFKNIESSTMKEWCRNYKCPERHTMHKI